MVDMNVAKVAYQTAKSLGASDKVMLALFEAGLVESNFTNHGHLGAKNDHDSLGFLQQRPSMGWPNPTDVKTATTSFVNKAKAKEPYYSTAGQLAQAVQVSAFPFRYDQRRGEAEALIKKVEAELAGKGGAVNVDLNPLDDGIEELKNLTQGLIKIFRTLSDPYTWQRLIYFGLGVGVGIIALIALVRGTRVAYAASDALESGVKAGLKVIPMGKVAKGVTKVVT